MDRRADLRAEVRCGTEKLLGHPPAPGLGQDGDHAGGTPVRGPAVTRRRSRRVGARRQGAASEEQPHGLVDLCVERSVEDEQGAVVLQGPRRPDGRRAARVAPRARAERGGAHPGEPVGGHGRPSLGVDLAGVAEALGHGEHRGQRQLHLLRPVIVLELEVPHRAPVLQPADAAGEGEVQQLGQLGPDLTGLAVDGVAAEQDEVEGTGGAQCGGQGARRGQGVGAGEGRVAHVQAVVGTPGHRLAQDVLRAGRPERDHGAGPTAVPGQRDALGHGAAAVRVHLEAHPGADQPAAVELERLGHRDLLRQGRDPQRASHRPAHRPT